MDIITFDVPGVRAWMTRSTETGAMLHVERGGLSITLHAEPGSQPDPDTIAKLCQALQGITDTNQQTKHLQQ